MYATDDPFGYPSFFFDVRASRWNDFDQLIEAHANQRLAVVIFGKVRSAPVLDSKLIGGGFIEGRFKEDEIARWIEAFRKLEGPLRILEVR